ncbi:hypothetical protein I601_1561 [Nocardioides dokdonensis FR1436]|uniref:Uncharacterized protein n=1 Tax=Nocardioides dokdonensis FR1436 TaxID=1300347 RepID=A0A1A9GIC8_9ACTN|nr:hypothetical protein [Nocardioides dokdonensis]ANH37994.1 hypothetical protein I601_1561 [Nocardioides dokdonensis FR1436]
MSDPQPRVRVTGPPRRRTPLARTREVDDETPLGSLYLGSLLREQLWLALRTLLVLALTLGLLPVLFVLVPGLDEIAVLGLPLPWLLLGVLVYPFLVLLGWRYVLRAERNEEAFVELMGAERKPEPGPGPEDRSRR